MTKIRSRHIQIRSGKGIEDGGVTLFEDPEGSSREFVYEAEMLMDWLTSYIPSRTYISLVERILSREFVVIDGMIEWGGPADRTVLPAILNTALEEYNAKIAGLTPRREVTIRVIVEDNT
jgi:hypothetical protein